MGIGYFPTIYEDELIYSVLARFYAHSGYLSYVLCAEDIYMYKTKRPDTEFVNKIKPEIVEIIGKQMAWEDVIRKHTMYPYYSRFLEKEKKDKAKQALTDMGNPDDNSIRNASFNKLLSLPVNKNAYLKYCPYCSAEDRKIYGETYWHRRHQIRGLDFCYKHGCKLSESSIAIKYNGEHLTCAENEIDMEEKEVYCSDSLRSYAMYSVEILEQDNYQTCSIGKYMELRAKQQYSRGRKKIVCSEMFMQAYQKWKEQTGLDETEQKVASIRGMFEGYRKNPVEICKMAYFLGITPEEMAYPEFSNGVSDAFYADVENMILSGMSVIAISKKLGVSSAPIIKVCSEKGIHSVYTSRKNQKVQSKAKEQRLLIERKFWLEVKEKHPGMSLKQLCAIDGYERHLMYLRRTDKEWTDKHYFYKESRDLRDWKKLDEETLPLLQNEIEKMLDEDTSVKITYSLMERKLNLYKGIWKKLPQCKAVIDRYRIS